MLVATGAADGAVSLFVPNPIAACNGVTGPFPANGAGSATWWAHAWDVQKLAGRSRPVCPGCSAP